MKKGLLVAASVLAVMSVSGLSSCGSETYELAVVTDIGSINDHSFNEACYKGMVDYASEKGISYSYYQPTENSTANRISTIDTAVSKGAKVIVLPGYLFNSTIKSVQGTYPDVKFLAVDCDPSDDDNNYTPYTFNSNVISLKYYENQAGFFAGYAAVKEGYTKLGFLGGMAVPAVVKYGQGYLYGAEMAAEEMGLADGAVSVNYWYCGGFSPTSDIQTKMSSWYSAGTECIFSCGGGIYSSAVSAAETANKSLATGAKKKTVIGVDVDQSNESDLIITSAMKNMEPTVKQYLTDLYSNDMAWPTKVAGTTITLGVSDNAVGLPTDSYTDSEGTTIDPWRLTGLTKTAYTALYAKVKAGDYTGLSALTDGDDTTTETRAAAWTKLALSKDE